METPTDAVTTSPEPLKPLDVLRAVLPLLDEYQRVLESLGHPPPMVDYVVREDVKRAVDEGMGRA